MNDSPPSPPDLKSQSPASIADGPPPASASGAPGSSRKYWWVPVLTLVLGLGVALALVSGRPPTYVARGSLWLTPAVLLPEGRQAAGDLQEFLATQADLLQNTAIMGRALDRVKSTKRDVLVLDKDGRPVAVDLKVSRNTNSSVFIIEAASASPDYIVAYLNALIDEFLAFHRQIHASVSMNTYTAVSDQIKRAEVDLQIVREKFAEYQRSNNLAVVQVHAAATEESLRRLIAQLWELRLEDEVSRGRESAPAETAAHQAMRLKMECLEKAIKEFETYLNEANKSMSEADRLKQNVQREQGLYDSLRATLQNVDLSRSLAQEQFTILDRPAPAIRDYSREKRLLATGGLGGLGVGLGLTLLVGLNRALRRTYKAPLSQR